MTEMVISPAPGLSFSQSYYSAGKASAYISEGVAFRQGQARWDNGYNIEWIAGFPQKVAGWAAATDTMLEGIPRAILVWRDADGDARIGVGTETHLYDVEPTTGDVTDITPLRNLVTRSLTDVVTTTINSPLVLVTDSQSELAVGDWVFVQTTTAVGGLSFDGWYFVDSSSPGASFTFLAPQDATSSSGPGGGATTCIYQRVALTDPFATTSGLTTVTVTHTAHGAAVDDFVIYSGATAVGGLTLNGEYQIASVVDVNTYTITAASQASSTTTGGGTVSTIYLIPVQQQVQQNDLGYGTGAYGIGAYSASSVATAPALSNGWTLAAYGTQLLACPIGGTIYVHDTIQNGRAYPLNNAPTHINAMFVTGERFVVALGLGTNQMEMAWADQDDYTQWTSAVDNTAESGRTLQGGSYLVGGIAVRPGQSLVFSNRCVFSMSYTGSAFIYSTQQVGDNCGLVAPTAVCCEGGTAFWMSDWDFWTWNGTPTALPTDDVRNHVFETGINRQQLPKCTVMLNRTKRQVRFFYPGVSEVENSQGVIFQYDANCWSLLNFGRSAGVDASLLSTPVSCDTNGIVFFDETGVDANGVALPWFLQLGLLDVSSGDRNVDVMGFTPDFDSFAGDIDLNIMTQYYPLQTASTDGPFTIDDSTTRIDLRSDGKMFAFNIGANEIGSDFRLGLPRLDIQPSGARR